MPKSTRSGDTSPRRIVRRVATAVIAICASLAAPAAAAPAAPSYRLTDLDAFVPPALPYCEFNLGYPDLSAHAVTNGGLVVGDYQYHCDYSREGFLLTPPAGSDAWSFQRLPRFRPDWGHGWNASALDVNESGTIVGWSTNQDVRGGRPVAWVNGQLHELGWLGLPPESDPVSTRLGYAYGVNDDGTIVGSSITSSGDYHPFRSDGHTMTDLGVPGGYAHAAAVAIADSGAVAINAGDSQVAVPGSLVGASRAFLIRAGRLRQLGDLGGGSSAAADVNESGFVVGWSLTAANERHAVLWKGGAIRDLGPGRALAVNKAGDVVGVTGPAHASEAFLYRNGRRYRLDDLLPHDAGRHIGTASDINDRGEIVGGGILLTPER